MRTTFFQKMWWAPCLAFGMLVAGPAASQSSGNPKGTMPPASNDSAKSPAGGGAAGAGGSTDTGKLTTDKGAAEARMHTNRGPGTGTAGGLPKKTPADGAQRNGNGDKAGSQMKPDPK